MIFASRKEEAKKIAARKEEPALPRQRLPSALLAAGRAGRPRAQRAATSIYVVYRRFYPSTLFMYLYILLNRAGAPARVCARSAFDAVCQGFRKRFIFKGLRSFASRYSGASG